ncbi:NAD(P)H-dependent flavin oxidoreductase [Kushneria indalinina]|uniref:Nitronate monooxygenase n=1 Tax=Kushneria indalinina DSM 14324 TaxID=1122140 RepID=A0A3D9DVM9_9GAMM|nr:nitronate monooxygenase [Kushneria indalinina]REC94806.1 nitronate monooxygenase [Kushneria indalinina DSM 14324]
MTAALPVSLPLIQAPMAGVSTPELAAAVSDAGALGSIAIGAATPDAARSMIERTRTLTDRPFNVNVFCHRTPSVDAEREARWLSGLAPLFARFDAEPPERLETIYTSFNDDPAMQALLCEQRPAVVSFHFGLPPQPVIDALKGCGITLLATATTLAEGRAIEAAGVDVIVAQGSEAGGHRGVFEPERGDALLGVLPLVRMLVQNTSIPVIAAGGVMDGAGIDAVLAAGGGGVQLGTAFIACPESAASDTHRVWLAGAHSLETVVTSVISGRPARALVNGHTREIAPIEVPDYPRAYLVGKALAAAASKAGEEAFEVCWAGQGAALSRALPAGELVLQLCAESRNLQGQLKIVE